MLSDLMQSSKGRRWLFATLYASEGAPMGLIWWALPTLLSREGVPLPAITALTATVTLPWILKFLAGPLVDASLQRGASLRAWILVCQSGMVVTILATAFIDWPTQMGWLTFVLVAHAICAATQDVAIDTLAIRTVPPDELGRTNGWMQAGMLTGRALVAGISLALATQFGIAGPIALVVGLVLVPMGLLAGVRMPQMETPAPLAGVRAWLGALSGRNMLFGLGVALIAGAGFEFLGVAIGPLLVERGAAEGTSAGFYGIAAPLALIAGALLGGRVADRVHPRRGTVAGLLAIAVVAGGVGGVLAAGLAADTRALLVAFVLLYVSIGFFTASSYALFMQLARGRLSATRFAVFMALTNACESWSGYVGGGLQGQWGYGSAMLILAGISLLALPLLAALRTAGPGRDIAAVQQA